MANSTALLAKTSARAATSVSADAGQEQTLRTHWYTPAWGGMNSTFCSSVLLGAMMVLFFTMSHWYGKLSTWGGVGVGDGKKKKKNRVVESFSRRFSPDILKTIVKRVALLPAHLLSIDGQAGDGDGHLLPPLGGVEEAEGGLGGDADAAGVGEPQLLWHHHLA